MSEKAHFSMIVLTCSNISFILKRNCFPFLNFSMFYHLKKNLSRNRLFFIPVFAIFTNKKTGTNLITRQLGKCTTWWCRRETIWKASLLCIPWNKSYYMCNWRFKYLCSNRENNGTVCHRWHRMRLWRQVKLIIIVFPLGMRLIHVGVCHYMYF